VILVDALAIVLGILFFAVLLLMVRGIERI
jgi:hypothetical protein